MFLDAPLALCSVEAGPDVDPGWSEIVQAWPTLTNDGRKAVAAAVDAARRWTEFQTWRDRIVPLLVDLGVANGWHPKHTPKTATTGTVYITFAQNGKHKRTVRISDHTSTSVPHTMLQVIWRHEHEAAIGEVLAALQREGW